MSPSGYLMRLRTTQDVGSLVRDYRTKQGLTQMQLADKVGVSRKWIIDLEAGKRATDLSLVLRTLNALGIELEAREPTVRHDEDALVLDRIIEESQRGR